jgi:hypothetical protein
MPRLCFRNLMRLDPLCGERHLRRRSGRRAGAGRVFGYRKETGFMADALMIVLGIGFFVAAVFYTLACDRM